MKLSEVRLSNTFSVVVIILVVGVFLLPALGVNFMFWLAGREQQNQLTSLNQQIENRVRLVTLSLKKLRVVDPALIKCISELALEEAKIPPTSSGGIDSVVELQWLSCSNQGVSSLEGVEVLEQLRSIELKNNKITQIEPLAGMQQLEQLDLSNNAVTSLDALAYLPNLKTINLSGNQLGSVNPLLSIASLQSVDMPDVNGIYCVDVEQFLNTAKFVVRGSWNSNSCKGQYSSNIGRITALKNAGNGLTLEDKELLLEYELNNMKKNYRKNHE